MTDGNISLSVRISVVFYYILYKKTSNREVEESRSLPETSEFTRVTYSLRQKSDRARTGQQNIHVPAQTQWTQQVRTCNSIKSTH